MKYSIFTWCFIVFLLFSLTLEQQYEDSQYTFADFVRQYNKHYDADQYAFRQQVFAENYARLRQLQSQANGDCHYKVNNMTDWTQQEVLAHTGYNSNTLGRSASKYRSPLRSSGSLSYPASLDYRSLGKVSEVKDQSSCGSCWAFSSTALYESLLLIETGIQYDLAQQYLLDCTLSSYTCNGGHSIQAIELAADDGIPLETAYPYASSYQYYGTQICQANNKVKLSSNVIRTQHYGSVTEAQLKELLYNHGPLAVAVSVNYGFQAYSSGIYSGCNSSAMFNLNHAVLLVGYTSQGHWIIKNSWGTDYGQNGFITIHKDHNCGLTSYVDVVQLQSNANNNNVNTLQYTVTMTDSYNDGWHGLSIGIKQDNEIVSSFGGDFTSGGSYGPIIISVKQGIQASLVVTQIASWTQQVGFTLTDNHGNVIYSRSSGNSFTSDTVFETWCPGPGNCEVKTHMNLTIQLTDSYGDGWNGNIIGLRQNGVIVGKFGQNFTSGHNYGPIIIQIPLHVSTDVVVQTMGTYTYQMGFTIYDDENNEIVSHSSGVSSFSSTKIFGTFTVGNLNLMQVRVADILAVDQDKPINDPLDVHYKVSSGQEKQSQTHETSETQQKNTTVSFIVSISILSFLTIFFMVTSAFLFYLWNKSRKELQEVKYRSIEYQSSENHGRGPINDTMQTEGCADQVVNG